MRIRFETCALFLVAATTACGSESGPTPPAPQVLTSLSITPGAATLTAGATQQFAVTGLDAAGSPMTVTPVWSVTGGAGSIDATGRFTAGSVAGTFANAVRASVGSVTGMATIVVSPISGPIAPIVPTPATMTVLGRGDFKPARITGEVFVRGTTAYTTTWGNTGTGIIGSAFYIWDVSADIPRLLDSVRVDSARTLGDVAVSDDGALLVVATEFAPGSIVIYSLADPRKPVRLSRFTNANTNTGVHTAEIGRVNGRLYAFLSVNRGVEPSRIVIVDLTDPSAPQQVYAQAVGNPFIHDTFVRDGLLFLGLWNDGVAILDIGGGGRGGTPPAPVELGRVRTAGGQVHNIWWLKDPVTGSAKYAFIGQEGPGSVGSGSSGDVHVVDVSVMSAPREVAFFTVAGAGTHNFSVDEPNGILYAAYYNGGVRALDVRGDLGTCTDLQRSTPAGSTVPLCDLRKMGRELGIGLLDRGIAVFIWGVQYVSGAMYASDMNNGIWKLRPVTRP